MEYPAIVHERQGRFDHRKIFRPPGVETPGSNIGVFDVTPYLEKLIFKELKEYNCFRRAKIEYGTLTWPN